MAFANAALNTHAHPCTVTYTHIPKTFFFFMFVTPVNSQVLSLQPAAYPSTQCVCRYGGLCM